MLFFFLKNSGIMLFISGDWRLLGQVRRACRMEHIAVGFCVWSSASGQQPERKRSKSNSAHYRLQSAATPNRPTHYACAVWCAAAEFLLPTRVAACWRSWPQRAGTAARRPCTGSLLGRDLGESRALFGGVRVLVGSLNGRVRGASERRKKNISTRSFLNYKTFRIFEYI